MLKAVGVVGAAATAIEKVIVFVNCGELESEAVIANVEVPVAVGVPEITPALDSVRPAGKLPDEMVHAYGCVPPVAVNATL
jgi:hypothetical protein